MASLESYTEEQLRDLLATAEATAGRANVLGPFSMMVIAQELNSRGLWFTNTGLPLLERLPGPAEDWPVDYQLPEEE